jgi:hypothetical protein
MTDIDPIEPLGGTSWTRIVRRRTRDEDPHGRGDGTYEDEPEQQDEPLEEDDDGQPHIDIRV